MSKKIVIKALTREIESLEESLQWAQSDIQRIRLGAEYLREENRRLVEEKSMIGVKGYATLDELAALLDTTYVAKNKIAAIKTVRAATNCGLREAKDFVEGTILKKGE